MSNYEAKQAEKRARYAASAEKARNEAASKSKAARGMSSHIPLGQPVLIGHHSEKRHRRDLAKINRLHDGAHEAHKRAEHYDRKAESFGTHSISADDPDAITKLSEKLARMETEREEIKTANRLARKNGGEPRPKWVLSNLGGNIRRVRERIKELEVKASREPAVTVECDGFTIEECTEDNRIRFMFEGKPAAPVRAIMKKNGFRWAPSVGAWQRQTTNAARYSAQCCQREIAALKVAA